MALTVLEKTALWASGLTAVGIGACILTAPHAFFASYAITLDDDPSLLSELRAPAAGLAAFGVFILAGLWRAALTPLSKAAAMTIFLAFPAGRIIGVIVDGLPSAPIIGALLFELAIAALCVLAFGRGATPIRAKHPIGRPKH